MEEGFWKDVRNHMGLMYSYVKEHGIEAYNELAQKDPERAIKEFPKFLEKILNVGNGFFRGTNCGGPMPEITAPLLNTLGSLYPNLDKNSRKITLSKAIGFLDGLNYFYSQNQMEWINEPWLVGDIIANRWIYWCGYQEYTDKLDKCSTWQDVEEKFIKTRKSKEQEENYFDIKSFFWFAYPMINEKHSTLEMRMTFGELFPEILDRTLDAAATLSVSWGAIDETRDGEKRVPYRESVEEGIKKYAPEFQERIIEKINERKWIVSLENENSEQLRAAGEFMNSKNVLIN